MSLPNWFFRIRSEHIKSHSTEKTNGKPSYVTTAHAAASQQMCLWRSVFFSNTNTDGEHFSGWCCRLSGESNIFPVWQMHCQLQILFLALWVTRNPLWSKNVRVETHWNLCYTTKRIVSCCVTKNIWHSYSVFPVCFLTIRITECFPWTQTMFHFVGVNFRITPTARLGHHEAEKKRYFNLWGTSQALNSTKESKQCK